MSISLYETIKNIKDGETEKIVDVVTMFKPLIKKYSRKLRYDEAETDLIITLIEILQFMDLSNFHSENDGAIVSYIYNVMRNKHIDLFRKYIQRKKDEIELNLDILTDTVIYDLDEKIFIWSLLDMLPDAQRIVLIEKYIKDHSDIQIAKKLNISRQAVNRTKIEPYEF